MDYRSDHDLMHRIGHIDNITGLVQLSDMAVASGVWSDIDTREQAFFLLLFAQENGMPFTKALREFEYVNGICRRKGTKYE